MNFKFVIGCAMAYVCPKSYAKNLGVFLSYHQNCINILIYINYCIDYTHTLYIFNKIFCESCKFWRALRFIKIMCTQWKNKEKLHFQNLTWSNVFSPWPFHYDFFKKIDIHGYD